MMGEHNQGALRRRLGILSFCVLASSILSIGLKGQQEAMNAQFIMNTMVINPGYTGYKEVQSITMNHRSQWIGFDGAPITTSVGFDMVLPRNKELAFGGNLMHDKIGPTSELSLTGNFAYRFQTSRSSHLSIGLKGYFGLFQARFTSLKLTSEVFGTEDVNFSYNPSNQSLVNFGVGAYYHSEDYFIGISSPRIMKNRIDDNPDLMIYNTVRGRTQPTYYFMAGYIFPCNMWVDFQPALITRATAGAPLSMALYGTFILKDRWRIGGFYGYREVAGFILQMQLNDKMRIGYSFDLATNELIITNFGSHELSLTYDFKSFRKRVVYPRRF